MVFWLKVPFWFPLLDPEPYQLLRAIAILVELSVFCFFAARLFVRWEQG